MAGYYESNYEHSASIKCEELLANWEASRF